MSSLFCIRAYFDRIPGQGVHFSTVGGSLSLKGGFILRLGGSRFLQIMQIIVVSVKIVDLRLIIIT